MVFKSSLSVALWTMISRVSGFIRDAVMAKYLGSGMMSDCLFAASKLPNSFRRLLGEGAMSSIFVPIFSAKLAKGDKSEAVIFANRIITVLLATLIFITIVCEIYMEEIVSAISPGFSEDPNKFTLTVNLARINFLYLISICLSALLGGVLNSIYKFAYFASIPVILNLGLVLTFLLYGDHVEIARISSYVTVLIGVLQLGMLIFACRKYGIGFSLKLSYLKPSNEVKSFLKRMLGGLVGSSVYQINIFFDTIFASLTSGGVSYLYYTDRINQLPITLIGGTLGVSLLPILSSHIKLGKFDQMQKIHIQCFVFVIIASGFCVSSILSLADAMVSFIYQRGSFTLEDTLIVSKMLKIFSLGFIFCIMSKLYNAFLFASQNPKIPMFIGIFATVINIAVNFLLYKKMGYYCVVYATLISSVVSGILSMYYATKMNLVKLRGIFTPRVALLSLILVGLYILQKKIYLFLSFTVKSETLSLFITLMITGILYIFSILAIKLYSTENIKMLLRKNA